MNKNIVMDNIVIGPFMVGVDFSLSCPCICSFNKDFVNSKFYFLTVKETVKFKSLPKNIEWDVISYNGQLQRYEVICKKLVKRIKSWNVSEINIEGYSMGAKGRVFDLAEATGIFKYNLYQSGIKINIFPPSQIKKCATGKGNANKALMLDTLKQECDLGWFSVFETSQIQSPLNDIVDAYYISRMKNP